MPKKAMGHQIDHWSVPSAMIRRAFVVLSCLSLCTCGQEINPEVEKAPIGSFASQRAGPSNVLSPDRVLGRWVLITLNGSPLVVADDSEQEAWIEFSPPCYETGDGHCNEAFDGGWEPAEPQSGRLGLRGYSGCNWFGSEAILEDNLLVAKPVISTERGCGKIGPQEAKIQELVSEKSSLVRWNNTLQISNEMGDRMVAVLSIQ